MTEIDSELQKIIYGCLNNDRVSQRRLYDRYSPKMYVVCQRYASSREEAEDMLMEGFMNVFKSLSTYKGDSKFSTWIYSVMVNTAVSHYRSMKRFRKELLSSDILDGDEYKEDEKITASLEASRLLELLEQMPDGMRVVFNLKAVEEYSFSEIAEMLDKKENAIRISYMRARQWMMEAMRR